MVDVKINGKAIRAALEGTVIPIISKFLSQQDGGGGRTIPEFLNGDARLIFEKITLSSIILAHPLVPKDLGALSKLGDTRANGDGIFGGNLLHLIQDFQSNPHNSPMIIKALSDGEIGFPITDPSKWGYIYEVLMGTTIHTGGKSALQQGDVDDDRKRLGAHFTPPALVDEVVRPTLGQLFYQFWDEAGGDPDKYIARIKRMTLCDPAMGGGAFLWRASKEIAAEIAWTQKYSKPRYQSIPNWDEPLEVGDTFGGLETWESLKNDIAVHITHVIDHCIYGLDINPLACDLTRWVLWILQREYGAEPPHLPPHLKAGDALVGLRMRDVQDVLEPWVRQSQSVKAKADFLGGFM